MTIPTPRFFLVATLALAATVARAIPVTVTENGIGANEVVDITSSTLSSSGVYVYAGVVKLTVNGVATNGFCIDPWHWSSSGSMTYQLEPLSSAPKDPVTGQVNSGMGVLAATQIAQLWQQYYNTALTNNLVAAALQVSIWKIVDNAIPDGTFSLLTNDASLNTELTVMSNFLTSNPNAPTANLAAITSGYTQTNSGQDYVIQNVPDAAGTLGLCGLSLLAVAALRRRRR